MAFSSEWEEQYSRGAQLSVWPWSDLVSYVYRYASPDRGFKKVLELGCGAGANIALFKKLGCEYWGIEGSAEIVRLLHTQYPDFAQHIFAGDFTLKIPMQEMFDCIVDRSALTHNSSHDIARALKLIYAKLRVGGKLLGVDWFSAAHMDSSLGIAIDDYTRSEIPRGQFKGVGRVHFSDREHLVGLLTTAGFCVERLEHKVLESHVPAERDMKAWWNFVAVKP